ncbi:hypothetical protein EV363DRAFT_1295276 [Boletus edulis]|nr:hypothetical protein EV363DRAFT_1295276 [Boletus edulis]
MPKRDDNPSNEKQQDKRHRVTLSLGNKNGTGDPQPVNKGSLTEQQQLKSSRSTTAIESNYSTDAPQPIESPTVESNSNNNADMHDACPSSQKEGFSTEHLQTESGRTSLTAKGNVKEVVQGPSQTLEKGKSKQIRNVTINQKEDIATLKISVQSIITIPMQRLVDEDQVTCYNKVLQQRIKTLSSYINKDAIVYALGKLLPTTTWGIFQPQANRRNELCDPATNDPIIIWTVGHVASSWFTKNGDSLNGVRAIKWQSEKGSSEPILFDEVYNARDVFTNKKDMPHITATELQKNDLVLLEGKITRYRTQDEDKKWTLLHVQMELLAVSLLSCAVLQDSQKPISGIREISGLRI